MKRFYGDDTMNFAVLLSLGFAYHGIADVGETLAVVENVPNGDKEAWITEWTKMADRPTPCFSQDNFCNSRTRHCRG